MQEEETTEVNATVRSFGDRVQFYPTGNRFEDTVQSHRIGRCSDSTLQSSNRDVICPQRFGGVTVYNFLELLSVRGFAEWRRVVCIEPR